MTKKKAYDFLKSRDMRISESALSLIAGKSRMKAKEWYPKDRRALKDDLSLLNNAINIARSNKRKTVKYSDISLAMNAIQEGRYQARRDAKKRK